MYYLYNALLRRTKLYKRELLGEQGLRLTIDLSTEDALTAGSQSLDRLKYARL